MFKVGYSTILSRTHKIYMQCSAVQFGEAFSDTAVQNPPFVPNSAAHKVAKTTASQLLSPPIRSLPASCLASHCIELHWSDAAV
jgi:hypothetical protein